MKKQNAPATPVENNPVVVRLALNRIVESATNPRRIFEGMEDLISSVKEKGVIDPIMVRPILVKLDREIDLASFDLLATLDDPKRKFEIVYGARRYRAATLAELASIPAQVRLLNDQQTAEIQLIENLQRKDPHPLEEADGIGALLKIEGYTVELIAERIGKDRSYVYKRLALANLDQKIKDSFFAGGVNLAQCLRICRLPRKEDQLLAFDECFESKWNGSKRVPDYGKPSGLTGAALDAFINRDILLGLDSVGFKKDDAELVPSAGACVTCTKRTGANMALFEEAPKGDQCLDRACFNAKVDAFVKIRMQAADVSDDSLLFISANYNAPKLPPNVIPTSQWSDARKECKEKHKALIVDGNGRGSIRSICLGTGCKDHAYLVSGPGGGGARSRSLSFAEVWEEKEKRMNERIALETSRATLWEIFQAKSSPTPAALKLVAARIMNDYLRGDGQKILADAFDIKLDRSKFTEQVFNLEEMKIAGKLWPLILMSLAIAPFGRNAKHAAEVAELVGVDPKAIEKKVAGPMRGTFAASKKKAQERAKTEAAKKAKTKKTSTPATPKAAKKKAAK